MLRHDHEKKPYHLEGGDYQGIAKRILAGPRDGYPGYLREFSFEPGGRTPHHAHGWHHLVYVIAGSGKVEIEDREEVIETGAVVYIEGGKKHGFRNTGDGTLRFLCLVPESGDNYGDRD